VKFIQGCLASWMVVAACAQAQNVDHVPSVDTILSRMSQARVENRARLRSYQVTRDYRLFDSKKQNSRSEVVADVTFVPPDLKKFNIQRTTGLGLGEKIVRQMLEHEADVTKEFASTDLSAANYNFRYLREEEIHGHPCFVLQMIPKRKDKNLLQGTVWIDATAYRPRRTEGEPGKVPSWWLHNVKISLEYGDVGGMWLQTSSESTANVRFLGEHIMVSKDVDYKFTDVAAASRE
jgi:outer membrane lipoprotein-sorting protein